MYWSFAIFTSLQGNQKINLATYVFERKISETGSGTVQAGLKYGFRPFRIFKDLRQPAREYRYYRSGNGAFLKIIIDQLK